MLNKCSRNQAWYLYKKWSRGDISQAMIDKLFTEEALVNDIWGGWFVDFHYDL